jgi:hypothetical protein
LPIHRVPRSTLNEALKELFRTGEVVVAIADDGETRYEIRTRFVTAADSVETRPA